MDGENGCVGYLQTDSSSQPGVTDSKKITPGSNNDLASTEVTGAHSGPHTEN